MKRIYIFLLLVILVLAFPNSLWAQCPEEPEDYGYCDTIVVETFDCDHIYDTTGAYDSVRVAIYIVHDSNTFWYGGASKWAQDSLRGIQFPFIWWTEGCADSIVFPTYDHWNNKEITTVPPPYSNMHRSLFRHIVDTHTGDTTYNRMVEMVENEKSAWTVYTNFSADTIAISTCPMDPSCQSWWQGPYDPGPPESYGRVLFATLTFLVYMGDCDSMDICIDSCFWPPNTEFAMIRYDAGATSVYVPRHNLPICDTVTTDIRWIEDGTEEENRPTSFFVSQNYPNPFNPVTNFKVTLPKASHVKIEVFNILGQKIKTLVDEDMKAGIFIVDWDGKDERGMEASSGIYFYRIIADDFSDIKKMILLR